MEIQDSSFYRFKTVKRFCPLNNQLYFLCCQRKCENPAFICNQQQCQCLKNYHPKCKIIQANGILNKIYKKQKALPQQVCQSIKDIEKIYDQIIDRLSRDKESLQIWRQNYGVNEIEYKLMDIINKNRTQQITGKFMNMARKRINLEQKYEQWFDPNWVKEFWRQREKFFNQIFDDLSKCYLGYNLDIKELLEAWDARREAKINEQMMIKKARIQKYSPINQWILSKKRLFTMSKLTLNGNGKGRILKTIQGPNIVQIKYMNCFINLKQLTMNYNDIAKIQGLDRLSQLQYLSLYGNRISKIQNLDKLKKLRILVLSDNNIRIVENLQNLQCLKNLVIESNPIYGQNDTINQNPPNIILLLRLRQVNIKLDKSLVLNRY